MTRSLLAPLILLAFSAAAQPTPAPSPSPTIDPSIPASADATHKVIAYQVKEARAAIDPFAARAATNARIALALGRVQDAERKYTEAEATLKIAAPLAPADPAPHVLLGETYLHMKNAAAADAEFKAALPLGEAAVKASPNDPAGWYYLGVARQRVKKYDDAVAALGKARDLDPSNALPLFQLGVTKAFAEKWAEAVDLLSQALAKDSTIAYAYYYRALSQDKLGKKDQLLIDLDRFVKVAPDAPDADRARQILKSAKR
jgi:tetratricopeptide (TPR) repeat protein